MKSLIKNLRTGHIRINLPLRRCAECGKPIFFGEYCIANVSGPMHRKCATKLVMNKLRVDMMIRMQRDAAIEAESEQEFIPSFNTVVAGQVTRRAVATESADVSDAAWKKLGARHV